MNTDKAISRVRLLGKRIMIWGSLAAIALWLLWPTSPAEGHLGLGELFLLVAAPVAFGGTLWLIGWILESTNEKESRQ